jgi:hypothetical protein
MTFFVLLPHSDKSAEFFKAALDAFGSANCRELRPNAMLIWSTDNSKNIANTLDISITRCAMIFPLSATNSPNGTAPPEIWEWMISKLDPDGERHEPCRRTNGYCAGYLAAFERWAKGLFGRPKTQ